MSGRLPLRLREASCDFEEFFKVFFVPRFFSFRDQQGCLALFPFSSSPFSSPLFLFYCVLSPCLIPAPSLLQAIACLSQSAKISPGELMFWVPRVRDGEGGALALIRRAVREIGRSPSRGRWPTSLVLASQPPPLHRAVLPRMGNCASWRQPSRFAVISDPIRSPGSAPPG